MGALIGFIGGFITGQIFLICVLKKSGNRRTKS